MMATKVNGKAVAGVLTTLLLLGIGAAIWEVRANHVAHTTIIQNGNTRAMKCTTERSKDRERIRALEAAIFRIDENVADIKHRIERMDR